jgi:hypothetical protein
MQLHFKVFHKQVELIKFECIFNGQVDIVKISSSTGFPIANDPLYNEEVKKTAETVNKTNAKIHISDYQREYLDPSCSFCAQEYAEPDCSILWLHALSYSCKEWKFETQLPNWAK